MAPKCPSFVEETLDKVALAVECVIAITPHLRNFGGITGVMHESIDQRIGIKGNVGSHFRAVVLHTSDRGPVPASTSIRNDYDPTIIASMVFVLSVGEHVRLARRSSCIHCRDRLATS